MTTGGASRAEGRGNETTRAALLDAAVERFGRDGLRSTSVAEIARDVGVSPTTTYIYFATKADLFLAPVDHDADAVIREGLLAVDDPTDPRSWRGVLFMALLRSIEQHPLARRVLEGREPEVTPRILDLPSLDALKVLIAEDFRRSRDEGVLPVDADPTVLANASTAVILSLLMSALQLGDAVVERYAADITVLLDGLHGGFHHP